MSMQDYPCAGYVVPLKLFEPLLLQEEKEKFYEAIDYVDCELIEGIVGAICERNSFPPFVSIFCIDEEDFSEDINEDEIYVQFSVEDLYKMEEKPAHINLLNKGITPVFSKWCVWG